MMLLLAVKGTHNLKVGACASSRLRFFQRVHRLTCRSTLGSQACPFDIDSSIYVSIVVRPTFPTRPLSIRKRELFVMVTTITARLRRGSPLSDLHKDFTMFRTLLLQYLKKLVEGVVRDLTSPEAFHTVKVQSFKTECIKLCAKFGSKFPLPIETLPCYLQMLPCQSTTSTIPITRTFDFT